MFWKLTEPATRRGSTCHSVMSVVHPVVCPSVAGPLPLEMWFLGSSGIFFFEQLSFLWKKKFYPKFFLQWAVGEARHDTMLPSILVCPSEATSVLYVTRICWSQLLKLFSCGLLSVTKCAIHCVICITVWCKNSARNQHSEGERKLTKRQASDKLLWFAEPNWFLLVLHQRWFGSVHLISCYFDQKCVMYGSVRMRNWQKYVVSVSPILWKWGRFRLLEHLWFMWFWGLKTLRVLILLF